MATGWRKSLASLRARLVFWRSPRNRARAAGRDLATRARAWRTAVAGWRRPSLRAVGLAGLAVLLCGVAAAALHHRGAAMEVVREHPYFRVEQIEIHGTGSLVSENDLREWLGVRKGDSLWEATPDAVEARLEAHPMLRGATARRVFPGKLEIRVRERRPAAITVLDELYYLDRNGDSFGPLSPLHDRDYPVFTGVAAGTGGQRRWALRRAMRLLKRGEAGSFGFEISELHLDSDDGLVLYPAQPRVPIYLGWSAWEQRLKRAMRVLKSGPASIERLARIDLRFRDQVVVTVREPRPVLLSGERSGQVST